MESPVRDERPFKMESVLLDALKVALADPREHRLYRSGKLDGIFPSKIGISLEAANHALRYNLLEITRTEAKGPVSIEWVKVTPQGVEFVYTHDSPRAVLGEMRKVLISAKVGVPGMMGQLHGELEALSRKFAGEIDLYMKRLDSLTARVEETIRRMDATGPLLADPLQAIIPWGYDAMNYLEQRRQTGVGTPCPLPELFESLKAKHPCLTIPSFHDGLKRLADNRALKLNSASDMPLPEYALLDGSRMLYNVER